MFWRRRTRYYLAINNTDTGKAVIVMNTSFRDEQHAQDWCKAINNSTKLLDRETKISFTYEAL